ncbi:hypothetical protein [Parendozoicomonas sp. Alg238-R29]|uniref:hypothetical protein n=1 Tax=Parendozoicomonas sp. Alg238-R29 TaxID=2993446 RepID=UPI00248ED301|nr:hypothetical protein [Parendozoicomonas sp. Alg238-R29]
MFRAADQQPTTFIHNLSQLELANGSKGRIKIGADSKGRAVVKVTSNWSLVLWLKNTWGNSKAKQTLHDQALTTLRSTEISSIRIKERLVTDIRSGVFPFMSKSERRTINQTFGSKETVAKEQVNQHLLLEPTKALDTARQELERLKAKLPSVSIADTTVFMRATHSGALQDPDSAAEFEAFHTTLEQHFESTSQKRLYDQTSLNITAELLEDFETHAPQKFQEIRTGFAKRPDNYPAVKTYVNDLERRADLPHSATGDRPDHFTVQDLHALEMLASGSRTGVKVKESLEQSLHSPATEAVFNSAQEKLRNFDTHQLKGSIDQAQKLWLKMAKPRLPRLAKRVLRNRRNRILAQLKPQLAIAAEARAKLHTINSTVGRKWAPDVLRNPALCGPVLSKTYQQLEEVEKLAGQVMYDAQLQFMHDSHNSKPNHPQVVIEGGGPVGLISAMRQYEKGAKVVVLEKRDTLYNRPQVVRLDNQWGKDLRHHLGEQFDELVAPESGKAKIQPDGSIYIVTKALEDVLHTRLSELTASDPHKPPHIQRLAAHALTSVEPPNQLGGKYRVIAQYESKYDPGAEKNPKQQVREVFETDLLICAGGKESPTRSKFLNHCPVTQPKQYGVASWESPKIQNQGLDTFPAFQDVLATDTEFQNNYRTQLHETLHPFNGHVGIALSNAARKDLVRTLGLTEDDLSPLLNTVEGDDRTLLIEIINDLRDGRMNSDALTLDDMLPLINDNVCQLRTFENRNLVYLGMEIPDLAHQWMETVGSNLDPVERKEIQNTVRQLWFQASAEKQGVAQKLGVNLGMMNSQFATTFPVAQDKPLDHFTVIEGQHGGASLTIAASGDAATSPHFMTYSGLTSGRETIDALCSFTDQVASGTSSRADVDRKLTEDYEQTSEFVLYKGSNFLTARDPGAVKESLKENARKEMAALGATTSTGFSVTKDHGDSYLLNKGTDTFSLVIDENGRIQAEKYSTFTSGAEKLGKFSTFKHFELQCLS